MRSVIFMAVLLAVFIALLYAVLAKASGKYAQKQIREERVMTNVTPVPAPTEPWVRYNVPLDDDLQQYIEKLCREKEIPSSIVIAVIGVESNFTADCIGDNGNSYGLMQIWETEHHDRCLKLNAVNLCDPYQNVRVGIDILADLINTYDGDWDKALSFYNGDSTGRYAERVQAYAECLAEGVMPFNE